MGFVPFRARSDAKRNTTETAFRTSPGVPGTVNAASPAMCASMSIQGTNSFTSTLISDTRVESQEELLFLGEGPIGCRNRQPGASALPTQWSVNQSKHLALGARGLKPTCPVRPPEWATPHRDNDGWDRPGYRCTHPIQDANDVEPAQALVEHRSASGLAVQPASLLRDRHEAAPAICYWLPRRDHWPHELAPATQRACRPAVP